MNKKTETTRTTLRAPKALSKWAADKAGELGISTNAFIVLALQEKKTAEATSPNPTSAARQNPRERENHQ